MHVEVGCIALLCVAQARFLADTLAQSIVQNTLNLLHRSSATKDVTHKLTSNLADMQYHMDPTAAVAARTARSGTPSISMSRAEFLLGKAGNRSDEVEKLHAWDALAELVGMAEGSSGVLLGKLRPRRPAVPDSSRRKDWQSS